MREIKKILSTVPSVLIGVLTTILLSVVLVGCNGSSEEEGTGDKVAVPDVAIFYVSGHEGLLNNKSSNSYLDQVDSAGVAINNELRQSGYWVEEKYYVDDAYPVNNVGGYLALVEDLKEANKKWVKYGTKIILVAHSHGGVWLHSAIEKLPYLPVFCLVDLDTSSYGWGKIGVDHRSQSYNIIREPINRITIPYVRRDSSSEQTARYDIEDVIFSNVKYAYEVRSGERVSDRISNLIGAEYFDEKWNMRPDGSVKGLWGRFTGTTHKEVQSRYGTTVSLVTQWLLNRLAE